jgi:hypothetical protein
MPILETRVEIAECQHCHQQFYSARKGTKYCSEGCKLADWRERRGQ